MPLKAIFFDLDDTLLENNMERFLPAYLPALANCLAGQVSQEQLITALMKGVRAMNENMDAQQTLEQAFANNFFPLLSLAEDTARPYFDNFYAEQFGKLRKVTQPISIARPLLEGLQAENFPIIIATNPLFPRTAIRQRLDWAGLSGLTFAEITSYEDYHFCKPHPEYYAEILGVLGLNPDEALMVGNDWENDMVGAHAVGMATYWISDAPTVPNSAVPVLGHGTLAEFATWSQTAAWKKLHGTKPTRKGSLALLRASLAATQHILEGITGDQALLSPAEGEWCVVEVLCHLRDTDLEVHQPRLQNYQTQDSPFFAGIQPDAWANERPYKGTAYANALQGWLAARLQTLELLGQMTENDWQKTARHAQFGPTQLFEYLQIIAEHDRTHLRQLSTLSAFFQHAHLLRQHAP
jgi:FMN phosphatase YigB (HAD superfamily)